MCGACMVVGGHAHVHKQVFREFKLSLSSVLAWFPWSYGRVKMGCNRLADLVRARTPRRVLSAHTIDAGSVGNALGSQLI